MGRIIAQEGLRLSIKEHDTRTTTTIPVTGQRNDIRPENNVYEVCYGAGKRRQFNS